MTMPRRLGMGLGWLALFALLSVAGCGCGDDTKKPPSVGNEEDASKPDKDAGEGNGGNGGKGGKGGVGGSEMDAGWDSGLSRDSGVDSGMDATQPNPGDPDAGSAPADWTNCPADLWADGTCDCGCGHLDYDCFGSGCKEPGCLQNSCETCFSASGAWMACTAPLADTCGTDLTAGACDCGCSAADPECHGMGCTEPGCWRSTCDWQHDSRTGSNAAYADGPGIGWYCERNRFGGNDGCDCGCGDFDPDCDSTLTACSNGRCNAPDCDVCHMEDGRVIACADEIETGQWKCDPTLYSEGDNLTGACNCGCGVMDPDCYVFAPKGCTTHGCRPTGQFDCSTCTDSSLADSEIVGCTPKPPAQQWTCDVHHYGTHDGCDCGCGIEDPDCTPFGCETPGCPDDGLCDYCHDGPTDAVGDYMPCKPSPSTGWSCGDETDVRWTNAECDCGCGKPDPFCRIDDRKGCSTPGCNEPVCEFCNDANSVRGACSGTRWPTSGLCDPKTYGDGICDCGCGAEDSDVDCENDTGCGTTASCIAGGCELCHTGASGALVQCLAWTCDPAAYDDGDTCDCGCGMDDPDCTNQGCRLPGCNAAMCEVCHDPAGRPTKTCP